MYDNVRSIIQVLDKMHKSLLAHNYNMNLRLIIAVVIFGVFCVFLYGFLASAHNLVKPH